MALRALVVDASADVLSLFDTFARRFDVEGFKLHLTSKPHEALALLRRQPYALVLADDALPDEGARKILLEARRRHQAGYRALMTAYNEPSWDEATLAELALAGVLKKPFTITDLIALFERAARDARP